LEFPARDLAKTGSEQDHARMKLWNWQKRIFRRSGTNPHGRRGDPVGSRRATGAYARSLLAAIADSGRDAIESGATLTLSARRVVATALARQLVQSTIILDQSCRLHARRSFSSACFRLAFAEKPLIDMPVLP